jgi:hypothetical protein
MAQSVGSAQHVEHGIQIQNMEIQMTEFEDEVIKLLKQILAILKKASEK